ncbi:hypothetical protein BC941DRAFT_471102 [Chlamydoabsidia padenii]|nr:hypothetical protein BC941DRAFT_471102 [Chlamydoabsidia padenii]
MAGLETVIGTHNFAAENEDEISFRIGEAIVVLEKDEGYQDGWWQGRNARGEIGLFPMNYTTPVPHPLHTLEDKIDSLETAVTQMSLPKDTSGLPTPSVSTSSHQSMQQLSIPPKNTSSSSSNCSSNTTAPASSYQKKLSSKYVHHSVATSLQNPELQTCLPEDWSAEQVGSWLGLMGFSDMASTFKDQEITGDILLELDVESLKELNVTTFGKRFKIYNAIKVLADENGTRKEAATFYNNDSNSGNHSTSPLSSSGRSMLSRSSRSLQPHHLQYSDDDDLISHYSTAFQTTTATATATNAPISSSSSSSTVPNTSPIVPEDPRRMFSLDSSRPLMTNVPYPTGSIPTSRSTTPLNRSLSTTQQYQRRNDKFMNHMNYGRSVHDNTATTQSGATQPLSHRATNNYDSHHQQLGRSSTLSHQHFIGTHTTNAPPVGDNSSRYNFGRNSFSSSAKPQNSLPVASRASMDGIAQRLGHKDNTLPDMEGWLHKQGDKYKTWNKRWFVLKGANLFYFKSPKEIRMKGIINLRGYRIMNDETIYAGKFCFKAQHERERTFYFYTDTETSMKAWIKALIKATITRDFAAPVMSSSTIPTISLDAARRMKPRPPSVILKRDSDNNERPISPSIYDHRPFSLTYTNQPEPIMRVSMSNETRDNYSPNGISNNQNQNFGIILKEPPAPRPQYPSTSSSSSFIENMALHQESEYTSSNNDNRLSHHNQQQQQLQHDLPLNNIFYNEEEEDLIDPHQHHHQSPTISQQQTIADTNNKFDHDDLLLDSSVSLNNNSNITTSTSDVSSQQQHNRIDEPSEEVEEHHHENGDENNDTGQQPTIHTDENQEDERLSYEWDAMDYVNWMNQHYQDTTKINHVTELKTGQLLLDLLESISGKQVRRPATSGPLTSMQMLDNIVAAFKFMGREGVVVDGRYTIKDIFSGDEAKIMEMLRTIKDYADQPHTPPSDRMASGGTFGEDEQEKLKDLDEQ